MSGKVVIGAPVSASFAAYFGIIKSLPKAKAESVTLADHSDSIASLASEATDELKEVLFELSSLKHEMAQNRLF